MKKLLLIIAALIMFPFYKGLIAQNNLGSYHIVHLKGNKHSENRYKWRTETLKNNSLYRNVEFDLKFADNCKYILANSYYQLFKQKVFKLATSQNFGGKNSLRVGWCYNPDIDKIELSFYAHINHIEGIYIIIGNDTVVIRPEEPGREHCLLNVNINTNVWVNVKMAIGKFGMFMSVNDQSVVVSRNIYSWSPDGETTFVQANSYFENYPHHNEGAIQDMDFYISNAVVDNPDFPWPDPYSNCQFTAENISFMNTNIVEPEQDNQVYFASNNIFCSKKSASEVTHLPYEAPFTVIDTGKLVVFTAGNSIKLKEHFIARKGCNFIAKIAVVNPPMPITVVSEPDRILPILDFEAINATNVYTSIYKDNTLNELVFEGQGVFDENNHASIPLTNYDSLLPGHYQIINLYVNDCYRITHNYLIIKINTTAKESIEDDLATIESANVKKITNDTALKSNVDFFNNLSNTSSPIDINIPIIEKPDNLYPNPTN